jgi:ABC-2 type transport system permease protein
MTGHDSMFRYRTLLQSLVLRDIKVKYQGSALGFVWTLFNPLIMIVVLIAVFRVIVRIDLPHYWAFLLSGYFAWNFLSNSINAAMYTLTEHAHITRSIAFPKLVLILSAALSRLIEYLAALAVILVALALFHHGRVPASYAVVPALVLLQLGLAIGVMMPVATVSVFFKDVHHALPVLLMALFYLTPVFYPLSMIPDRFQSLYLANPFAQLLVLYHQVLYDGRLPSGPLLLGACLTTAVVVLVGLAIFNRFKGLFAEVV